MVMNEDDVERLLAGTKQAGPSPELRARVLSRRPFRRSWPWAAAAAAMLMLSILLQGGAAAARDRVKATMSAAPDLETELVTALRETGNFSESEARVIAVSQQVQMRIEQNRAGAEPPER